jgi:hypothetical protein
MLLLLVRVLQILGSLLECHRVQFSRQHFSTYLLLISLSWLTFNWLSLPMTRHYLVHMPKQSALNTIKRYYSTCRIKLNPSKSHAVFFTKRRTREVPTSDLSLDGYYIPWSERAKYLGLILHKKLTFYQCFDYVSDKVQKLTHIVYPLINGRCTLSLDQKVLLSKAIL